MTSLNVAIIEDCDHWIYLIKKTLSKGDHFNIVLDCKLGREFFEQYKSFKIDLVILDISLPETNGIEIAKKLKKECPQIPIVIFSSSKDLNDIKIFNAIGVKAFISKVRILNLYSDLCFAMGLISIKNQYNFKSLKIEEVDLIDLVCKKKLNREIAVLWDVDEKIIEYKLKKLCETLGIGNSKLSVMEFAVSYGYK